jgi:GTP cyclohydrolase IA
MNNAVNKKFEVLPEENKLSVITRELNLTPGEKIDKIEFHFREIMETLGLDLSDDSLKGTPRRVAKMYVEEIFQGLDPGSFPKISLFENSYAYKEMLVEKDIQVYSYCEHHFVPFIGKAHVAYYPADKVIGLSKINRIVKHFAKRPQVQERLTTDVANAMREILKTDDIAVHIEAKHLCVAARGAEDTKSSTVTSHLGGRFKIPGNREMFYAALK